MPKAPCGYTTARSNMLSLYFRLSLLSNIVIDEKLFCMHSLRSGANVAANNGKKYRLFKRHGRWKSEKAKDGYVKDDLEELLTVSLNFRFKVFIINELQIHRPLLASTNRSYYNFK